MLSASLSLSGSMVFGNQGCSGGGISVLGSTATITNSTVRDNLASCADTGVGGGIEVCGLFLCGFSGSTSLTLIGSTVSGNTAVEGVGGGIDIVLAHARVVGSTVRGNRANFSGGGINNQVGSDLTLSASLISGNVANGTGGGIENDIAKASISDTIFDHNSSPGFDPDSGVGGAIDNRSEASIDFGDFVVAGASSLSILRSTFIANTAVYGAAVSNLATGGEPATLTGSQLLLQGNTAVTWGGGVLNQDEGGGAVLTLAQSVLSRNQAQYGGGIVNNGAAGAATTTLKSGTLVSLNKALVDGGGIYDINNGVVNLTGAIVRKNIPDDCSGC